MKSEHSISAESIWFRYSSGWILEDVSLILRPREITGIIGANGSGKTTLLKVLSRLLVPQQGAIYYGDRNSATLRPLERADWVGYLPQVQVLPFPYRVEEVVAAGRAVRSAHPFFETSADRHYIQRALTTFHISPLAHRGVYTLSAGERQRVFLARLLAQNPRFFFLDEPSIFLDPGQKIGLMNTLKTLRDSGYGIVIATHDRELWPVLDHAFLLSEHRIHEVSVDHLFQPRFVAQTFPSPLDSSDSNVT